MEDVGKWRNRAANPITVPFACMKDKCCREVFSISAITKVPVRYQFSLLCVIIAQKLLKGGSELLIKFIKDTRAFDTNARLSDVA